MKLLIDTHILIWMIEKPSELSPQTKELIEDYSNTIYVSVESLREIVIKQRTGEIAIKTSFAEFCKLVKQYAVKVVNTEINHILTFERLLVPANHKDPFDHIIISTAITGKFTLISSDRKFLPYTKQGLNIFLNK